MTGGLQLTKFVLARDREVLADERGRRLLDEGIAALPDPYGDGREFMPKTPRTAPCQLCGEVRELTQEHVPPARALNLERIRVHTVDDWLRRQGDTLPGGDLIQGGIRAYTLCGPCNHLTGRRYADEYRRCAQIVINMLADAGVNVVELERQKSTRTGPFRIIGDPNDPRPGALVREILAMFCSVSAGFDLAGRYPAIRRMILDGAIEALPAGMSIGVTGYLSTRSRLSGPQLLVEPRFDSWRWVMEVAHAPLACLLLLASNGKTPAYVFDVSRFTEIGPGVRMPIEGTLEIGFGNTPLLGDYRTRAAVDADAGGSSIFVPCEVVT